MNEIKSITHQIPSLIDEIIRTNYDPTKLINFDKVIHQLKMRAVIGELPRLISDKQYFGWNKCNEYAWPFQQKYIHIIDNYNYLFNNPDYGIDKDYNEYSNNLKKYHRVLGRKPRERISKSEILVKAYSIGHYIEELL
jgi:hypothetical protein